MARPRRLEVTLHYADPGLPDSTWHVEMTEAGLSIRRKGSRNGQTYRAGWKTIIGGFLISQGE